MTRRARSVETPLFSASASTVVGSRSMSNDPLAEAAYSSSATAVSPLPQSLASAQRRLDVGHFHLLRVRHDPFVSSVDYPASDNSPTRPPVALRAAEVSRASAICWAARCGVTPVERARWRTWLTVSPMPSTRLWASSWL